MSNASSTRGQATIVIERSYRARIEDVWALWATKAGFESWWGPQGFRVEVHALEAHTGGVLRYDMIADTPEMIAAMAQMGAPTSHATTSRYTVVEPHARIVLTNVIDFLPGVETYESEIAVAFATHGDTVRMTVTLDTMHDDQFTRMQEEGFTSQLTKLDARFA